MSERQWVKRRGGAGRRGGGGGGGSVWVGGGGGGIWASGRESRAWQWVRRRRRPAELRSAHMLRRNKHVWRSMRADQQSHTEYVSQRRETTCAFDGSVHCVAWHGTHAPTMQPNMLSAAWFSMSRTTTCSILFCFGTGGSASVASRKRSIRALGGVNVVVNQTKTRWCVSC